MWDIKIFCDKLYFDIFKAYFIVNNFDYTEYEDGIVFYANTVDKFFIIVSGLNKFYHEHRKQGMESIDFVVGTNDDGTYYITPVRFVEY